MEVDTRFPPFQGTREWSTRYKMLTLDDDGSVPLSFYDRPVYLGEGAAFDILFYTGRRWAILTSESDQTLSEFLSNDFHTYWSDYTVGFLSEPVDTDTPEDAATPVGLRWMQAQTKQGGTISKNKTAISIQSADQNRPSEAIFLCAVCSKVNNPCWFGGFCNDDGSCTCTTGSLGTLCQIPPVGNGRCDAFFNTPEFAYDGGDCCEDTCTGTSQHSCGQGVIGSTGSVEAFGFIGFPQCHDKSSVISGSKTLFEIIKRGYLKCAISLLFEVDLCKAIAAAVLEDADAIELVNVTSANRFTELASGALDVLIRKTTYTAERDIYQVCIFIIMLEKNSL